MFFVLSAGALTVLMAIFLSIRQIFFGIQPDKFSSYPTPPRALITPLQAYSLPVFGHTRLFRRDGGQLLHRFCKTWREYGEFIPQYGRMLGSCFAIFIWAQWRVIVNGKRRAGVLLDKVGRGMVVGNGDGDSHVTVMEDDLKPAWAFFEPRPLLGNNCPAMITNPEERKVLVDLFGGLMTYEKIVRFTEEFSILADEFVDQLLEGELEVTLGGRGDSACKCFKRKKMSTVHPEKYLNTAVDGDEDTEKFHIGSHTLRHYSFDLINGPLLGLDIVPGQDKREKQKLEQQRRGYIGKLHDGDDISIKDDASTAQIKEKPKKGDVCGGKYRFLDMINSKYPSREKILTWMRRAQNGLLGFRFTVGGKWMQIWRLNEYGRAIHARHDIINTLLTDHISKKNNMSQRPVGLSTIDPLITPNPIYTFATQIEQHIDNMKIKMKRRNSAPEERSLLSIIERTFTSFSETPVPSLNTYVTLPSISSSLSQKSFVTRPASPVPPNLRSIAPAPSNPPSITPAPSNPPSISPAISHKSFVTQPVSPIPSTIQEDAEWDLDNGTSCLNTVLVPYEYGKPLSTERETPYSYSSEIRIGIEKHEQPRLLTSLSVIAPTSTRRPERSRERARSDTDLYIKTELLALFQKQQEESKKQRNVMNGENQVTAKKNTEKQMRSLLDDFLDQKDESGNVISQAAITDLSFLLWMSLDAGSAWTSMALHLFQHDSNALQTVRNELNYIERQYGTNFFSHLDEAQYLDAVVYEAIRLSPPFCGGMWTTGKTVELEEDGLQIPSGTHVIFSGVTTRPFDLEHVYGRKPQDLFHVYPCRHLYGFLPLNGKEIPLMVLQSKILLAAIVRRCDIIPQDIKKCDVTKCENRSRRRRKRFYSHSSESESQNTTYKSREIREKPSYEKMMKIDDPINLSSVTFDGINAKLSVEQAVSNHSSISFAPDKGGGTPLDKLLNLTMSSSSKSKDECSEGTSDSTALEVRSFEYPDDGDSQASPAIEECNNSISLQTAAQTSYMKNVELNPSRAITPDDCWKWFTKLPFPESLKSVTVASRKRPN